MGRRERSLKEAGGERKPKKGQREDTQDEVDSACGGGVGGQASGPEVRGLFGGARLISHLNMRQSQQIPG